MQSSITPPRSLCFEIAPRGAYQISVAIVICNQTRGVGKTHVTLLLAAAAGGRASG